MLKKWTTYPHVSRPSYRPATGSWPKFAQNLVEIRQQYQSGFESVLESVTKSYECSLSEVLPYKNFKTFWVVNKYVMSKKCQCQKKRKMQPMSRPGSRSARNNILYSIGPRPKLYHSTKFNSNPSITFWNILVTNRQTDRRTYRGYHVSEGKTLVLLETQQLSL